MDCTETIEKITKAVAKEMSKKGLTIEDIDWVLTQVKERLYASTLIKAID